jgi:hypothetical protein
LLTGQCAYPASCLQPDKFIEDICTLLKDESRWGWLRTPPDANGLSIETEDTLMMVALLAR